MCIIHNIYILLQAVFRSYIHNTTRLRGWRVEGHNIIIYLAILFARQPRLINLSRTRSLVYICCFFSKPHTTARRIPLRLHIIYYVMQVSIYVRAIRYSARSIIYTPVVIFIGFYFIIIFFAAFYII